MSRNADSACPFCIDSNTKKGMLSQQLVTHIAPPLAEGRNQGEGRGTRKGGGAGGGGGEAESVRNNFSILAAGKSNQSQQSNGYRFLVPS